MISSLWVKTEGGKKRFHVMVWFFVLFGAFLLANATLIYFALTSWTGLEVESHYNKGIAYNDTLAAAKAGEALGWNVDIDFQSIPVSALEGVKDGNLSVRITDATGNPLEGAEVAALFFRPTHEGFDRRLSLGSKGGGLYAVQASLPLAGQWDVRILIHHGDDSYGAKRRIVLK